MTLLDRIDEANSGDWARFEPLCIGEMALGWVHADLRDALLTTDGVAIGDSRRLELQGHGYQELSRAVGGLARALEQAPAGVRLRGEACHVFRDWLREPLFEADRALQSVLGFRGYGVHLNCYVRRRDRLFLWVAKRAATVHEFPNRLDTSVGGCLPAHAEPREWLLREAAEEAGLDPGVTVKARSVGITAHATTTGVSMSCGVQLNFDLEVGESISLRPVDGEVEGFELQDVEVVMQRLVATQDFKPHAALVTIDFLMRHGILAHSAPDYVALMTGLRRGLTVGVH